MDTLCAVFEVPRSNYYAHCRRAEQIDEARLSLRKRVNELFIQSRSSAGSRTLCDMMWQQHDITIGRFKVGRLMEELGLVSKQPGKHAYKQATVERPDIPNLLNREFTVSAPNQVWCGVVILPTCGRRSLVLLGSSIRFIYAPCCGLGTLRAPRC